LFDLPDELFEIPQGYKKVDFDSFKAALTRKLPASRPPKNNAVPRDEPAVITEPRVAPPQLADPPQVSADATAKTDVDSLPVLLNMPKPGYTPEARRNQIQGVVPVQITIGADGNVKKVRLLGGLPDGLNEQAIKTAYQYRYKPAMKNGKPVSFEMKIEIEFKLDSK
jgi:TonB family protein